MIFNYKLVKVLREKKGMSREGFSRETTIVSGGKFQLTISRLARLEDGKPAKFSGDELGYIFAILGEEPNYFYNLDSINKKEGGG